MEDVELEFSIKKWRLLLEKLSRNWLDQNWVPGLKI